MGEIMGALFSVFSCRLAGKLWSSILLLSFFFSFSFKNVYPLASYVCEWHNFFDQSYMFDLVKTFSNLFQCNQTCSKLFKVVQTCSNLFKTALFCSNMFKHAQTCFDQSYMFDLFQTFSNLFCSIIHVQTCSNFFKLVQTYSNLSKLVQTCSNLC